MLGRVLRLGTRGRLSARPVRAIAITTAALAALTMIIVVSWNSGYAADKVRLLSGVAWLPSSQVGQLTLLDGSSEEVAAQVPVASPGDRLDAVQSGTTGYAINYTTGSIRRVDGGTFEPTAPTTPISDAGEGLQAYASADALYALDTQHGVLTQTDPTTLTTRSGPSQLAVKVGAQGATLDQAGRLWVLDTTGDLTWIKDGQRHTRAQVTRPGSGMLVLADGSPVAIDTQAQTASILDPETGDTANTISLDLYPDDTIQVGGSTHAPRLHLVTAHSVLAICDLTSTSCGDMVPLGNAGAELGSPLEISDRVFIPDYTNGRVWIVDLQEKRVVAQPTILTPAPVNFQLLTRDGIVFFNDPDSERAGIIHLDGSVIHITKYDPQPSTTTSLNPASAAPPNPELTHDELPPPSTDPSATAPPTSNQNTPPPINSSSSPEPGEHPEPDRTPESGPEPGGGPSTAPGPAGPEVCATGDEVALELERETSGTTIPVTIDVKCPPSAGRTYALIVELYYDDMPYYYPKRRSTHIPSNPGTYPGSSINIEGSEPNTTRKIFVISINDNQVGELENTGSDGELAQLPDSSRLASQKYSHTRTS